MEGERWQRIERLFHVAMPLDKRQREALLDRSCADDESLRSEVASLLAHADEASSSLKAGICAVSWRYAKRQCTACFRNRRISNVA